MYKCNISISRVYFLLYLSEYKNIYVIIIYENKYYNTYFCVADILGIQLSPLLQRKSSWQSVSFILSCNRSGDRRDRIQISEARSAHGTRRSRMIMHPSHLLFSITDSLLTTFVVRYCKCNNPQCNLLQY